MNDSAEYQDGLSLIQINYPSKILRYYSLRRLSTEENTMGCCGSCGGEEQKPAQDQTEDKAKDAEKASKG
jgi:hypothetical protein